MDLDQMLQILASQDGSDLYLATGAPPCAKFQGILKTLSETPLPPGEVARIANSIMDEEQRQTFERELEMNLALSLHKVGRFPGQYLQATQRSLHRRPEHQAGYPALR